MAVMCAWAGLALSVALLAAPAQAEARHEIHLTRPAAVGQRVRIEAEGMEERIVKAVVHGGEWRVETIDFSIRFAADAEVREVDGGGRAVRVDYVLRTCVLNDEKGWREVLPAGAVVRATRLDAATLFELGAGLEGHVLDPTARRGLELVAGLHDLPRGELFGSDEPRRVGETWALRVAPAVQPLSTHWGVPVSPDNLSGTSTLLDAWPVDGQRCLLIRHHLLARDVLPRPEEFPPGFGVQEATLATTIRTLLPAGAGEPPRGVSIRTDLEAILTGVLGPDGAPVELHVSGTQAASREMTRIGPDLAAGP